MKSGDPARGNSSASKELLFKDVLYNTGGRIYPSLQL